jgi:rubrerythrin
MRLIDADECYKHLLLRVFDTWNDFWQVANTLTSSPTIEAEPVKHGKWVDEGTYITTAYGSLNVYKCSNCEMEIVVDDFDNYCPNCGARMDGE